MPRPASRLARKAGQFAEPSEPARNPYRVEAVRRAHRVCREGSQTNARYAAVGSAIFAAAGSGQTTAAWQGRTAWKPLAGRCGSWSIASSTRGFAMREADAAVPVMTFARPSQRRSARQQGWLPDWAGAPSAAARPAPADRMPPDPRETVPSAGPRPRPSRRTSQDAGRRGRGKTAVLL